MSLKEQINLIEEEISKTKYNKSTQLHVGLLKSKLAKLLNKQEQSSKKSKTNSKGFFIKKSGDSSVVLVGFPSVGKSSIINLLTNANSEVGNYNFTTLNIVPGILKYNDAKIQILDVPGLIKGASKGKGRGKEVISAIRSSDFILFIVDVINNNITSLIKELYDSGIRINTKKPEIIFSKTNKGGILINTTVSLTKLTKEIIQKILLNYGFSNLNVIIKEDITMDQLIDSLSSNIKYLPSAVAINKIDLSNEQTISKIEKKFTSFKTIKVSAQTEEGIPELKKLIYEHLDLIKVYLKPQGSSLEEITPLIIKKTSNIEEICRKIHKTFLNNFRYAVIRGNNVKHQGQIVGKDFLVEQGNIITIITKK